MLQLDRVQKTYTYKKQQIYALRQVTLQLDRGSFVAVCGPSGCGKSTMLFAAGGLLRPDDGVVKIDETNLYAISADQRAQYRAAEIGFVFQQFHLVPYLNVLDNVLSASLALEGIHRQIKIDLRDRAQELIERFKLTDRLSHVPSKLSIGEQQRTALARALLNQPRLLLADEPTGNLDDKNTEVVCQHLAEYAANGGMVLLVTHDLRVASYADNIVQMSDGTILADIADI